MSNSKQYMESFERVSKLSSIPKKINNDNSIQETHYTMNNNWAKPLFLQNSNEIILNPLKSLAKPIPIPRYN